MSDGLLSSFSSRLSPRIGGVLVGCLLLFVLTPGIFFSWRVREAAVVNAAATGERTADLFASICRIPLRMHDFATLQVNAESLLAQSDVMYVDVRNAQGQSVVPLGRNDIPPAKFVLTLRRDVIGLDGRHLGEVRIGMNLDQAHAEAGEVQTYMLALTGGALLLTIAVLTGFLRTVVTRPLEELAASVKRISAGDLDHRAKVASNDELGALARNFNEMAARLVGTSRQQRQAIVDLNHEVEQRKVAEANLLRVTREAQRARTVAESANQSKSDFLANMSHEIRTPMNAILGMAEVLDESGLNHEQQKYVATLRSAGSSLLALINDILDISKIEAGQMRLEFIPFDPVGEVNGTCDVLAVRARDKGLRLSADIAPTIPPRVVGDPFRLRQILVNLIGNAIKFTSAGEVRVTVEPGREPVLGRSSDDAMELLFTVTDTGVGIVPEKQERIFDAFTQADTSVTREYGGTGLGLAICRRLAELMGGRIWIDQSSDQGTVFAFTVVVGLCGDDRCNVAMVGAQDISAVLETPLRILLVEDSEYNRFVVEAYLRDSPHRIDVAENGAEALGRFATGRYDVLLMDMSMPVMDGYTATKRIREWERANDARRTPIVAMTAYALQGDRERCLEAGCDLHLPKPVRKHELLSALVRFGGAAQQTEGADVEPVGAPDMGPDEEA